MARKSMTAYRLMPSEEIGSFKQVKTATAFSKQLVNERISDCSLQHE
ncbi:uncharacterized protein RAG0_08421 [Rhynchosporium agropyri]|uniref:Uncharacterized protein n=1 Tax=Rhynchosporium agropyri TaxID=914238 RepID=A0A1E1KTU9_9HELO|nr:uncharacterized protein RAG0_08421 [Rhynchosporium agropyri]